MTNENIEHSGAKPKPKGPVDATAEVRPGVPMETDPPRAMPNAHWDRPEQQQQTVPVFLNKTRKELTPVFSSKLPPKGLSGVMRSVAYHYPDHWVRHWMLLLAADRVDVWEHRLGKVTGLAALAGVGGVIGAKLLKLRNA